jgi:hypothetical protein
MPTRLLSPISSSEILTWPCPCLLWLEPMLTLPSK